MEVRHQHNPVAEQRGWLDWQSFTFSYKRPEEATAAALRGTKKLKSRLRQPQPQGERRLYDWWKINWHRSHNNLQTRWHVRHTHVLPLTASPAHVGHFMVVGSSRWSPMADAFNHDVNKHAETSKKIKQQDLQSEDRTENRRAKLRTERPLFTAKNKTDGLLVVRQDH